MNNCNRLLSNFYVGCFLLVIVNLLLYLMFLIFLFYREKLKLKELGKWLSYIVSE